MMERFNIAAGEKAGLSDEILQCVENSRQNKLSFLFPMHHDMEKSRFLKGMPSNPLQHSASERGNPICHQNVHTMKSEHCAWIDMKCCCVDLSLLEEG